MILLRVLLLFRGAPGVGKSTFIKEHGFEPYTLSADSIRTMYASPVLNVDGKEEISQNHNKIVWETLRSILEYRMSNGEFTVIDAVNSKTSEINNYKSLCDKYRYRCYIVDMTDIPIDEVKRRNKSRPEYKQVPERAIDNIYSRFKTQKVPSGIKAIKPEDIDTIFGSVKDMTNEYKKVHVIGDVHGCYTVLKEYLNSYSDGEIKSDELYIFVGDYLDRGIENAATFEYLYSICKLPNVIMLEGNHEIHIQKWGHGVVSKSKEFELKTKTDLENCGVDKSNARSFYRKLWQCVHMKYGNNEYLITHGGLSRVPNNLTLYPTSILIKGIGTYNDSEICDESFVNNTESNVYQIHGHRNINKSPVQVNDRCFNLEGGVEFGGNLRVLQITPDGTHTPIEIKNNVFNEDTEDKPTPNESKCDTDIGTLIIEMRNNKFIHESSNGNISSFNFSKDVFYNKKWDEQTMKARGLFIDIPNAKIVARSYNKFFNINEVSETKLEWLKDKLMFPINLYRKENGFLGLVSYNPYTDDLFISSKSRVDSSHAGYLADILYGSCSEHTISLIKDFVRDNNVTMVFEVIDPVNDPHIIEYKSRSVVLLDIIYNDINFMKYSYKDMCDVADSFGLAHKHKAYTIDNWQDFMRLYDKCHTNEYKYLGEYIEGFVIEDSSGFMTKMKLNYYNIWKALRMVADITTRRGYINKTSMLTTPMMNMFYAFMRRLYNDREYSPIPDNIIALRNLFFSSDEGKDFEKIGCDLDN